MGIEKAFSFPHPRPPNMELDKAISQIAALKHVIKVKRV